LSDTRNKIQLTVYNVQSLVWSRILDGLVCTEDEEDSELNKERAAFADKEKMICFVSLSINRSIFVLILPKKQ